MQRTRIRRGLPWAAAGSLAAVFLLRRVLLALLVQLAAGYLLMALALPLCRVLEKAVSPGAASALSLLAVALAALATLLALIPPLLAQFRQLSESLPAVLSWGEELLARAQAFLQNRGLDLSALRNGFLTHISRIAGEMVSIAARAASHAVGTAGKLFLAPLIAFYLLRDRQRIVSALTLCIPVAYRARAIRAGREMRRETANFLRGQLLLSLTVGALTALGLLLTGTPGWLALGLLMGVMELLPYLGPLLAGLPAVLLSLQGGLSQALWTLVVLVLVQQVESSLLSPRLLSGATRLHPLLVLLAVSAGGMLGGAAGMLLALPIILCLRGAVRGARQ